MYFGKVSALTVPSINAFKYVYAAPIWQANRNEHGSITVADMHLADTAHHQRHRDNHQRHREANREIER
jgi:hypothetical protein